MKTTSRILQAPLRAARAGFTLLEMMVVISIIGLLAAFLVPNIMDAMARAKVTAEQGNMRELYQWLTVYKSSNNHAWPRESGQRFILRLWKDSTMERSEKNAKRFFSAGEPFSTYAAIQGVDPDMDVLEYLTDWDAIGADHINYAAFDPEGDPNLRRMLNNAPSKVTIIANSTFAHRNSIVYITADGEPHELNIQNLIDDGILTEDDVKNGLIPVGAGSPIEQLRSVSTN